MINTEIIDIVKNEKDFLFKMYSVTKIGIFGSYARGEQNKSSDVDLIIEFSHTPDLFTFIEIMNYLKSKIKRKVDLVIADSLRPEIKSKIMTEVVYL